MGVPAVNISQAIEYKAMILLQIDGIPNPKICCACHGNTFNEFVLLRCILVKV